MIPTRRRENAARAGGGATRRQAGLHRGRPRGGGTLGAGLWGGREATGWGRATPWAGLGGLSPESVGGRRRASGTFWTPSLQPAALAGNESAYPPNGAECYSCVGLSREACQGTAPPVVSCYNASDRVYKGCFDGNVTLTAGERVGSSGTTGVVVASLRPHGRWVALYPKSAPTSNTFWKL